MADEKGKEKKEKSLLEKIKALIIEDDSDSDKPVGTGGRKREKSIMDRVDAAVSGADEDNGVKK